MIDFRESGAALRAAFRLQHDLGKYIRLNAPAAGRESTEALRARLALDLRETRKTNDGSVGAVELFDAWRDEEGGRLAGDETAERRLAKIVEAVELLRRETPRLEALSREELEALDGATVVIQSESRDLYRELRRTRTEPEATHDD
jgi:hypothetical protein